MVNSILLIISKKLGLDAVKTIYSMYPEKIKGIVTINDEEDIRSSFSDIVAYSEERSIDLNIIKNQTEFAEIIKLKKPDLCFVLGWYWIINESVLKEVPFGFIGIHASLLPKYRGFSPIVWTIINGEKESGVSLFYFESGVDSGDIIDQKKFLIGEDEYVSDILLKVEAIVMQLLEENLPMIVKDVADKTKQNHKLASYCGQRQPKHGLINWSDTNKNIYNLIRALAPPYPGAFSFINKKKIVILNVSIIENEYYGIPGLVVKKDSEHVIICCGKGAICVNQVRLDSGEIKKATDVLKYNNQLGWSFLPQWE
jgi:methionyl-tRNA formyltransferase